MIVSRTPLRISFCGGGTDFEDYYKINGGAVISTTINKYIYVGVNRLFGGKIRVRYTQNETVNVIDDLVHNIAREALRMVGINKAIEIEITSDIPSQGSGLGSSSALCVGLLKALYKYKGYDIPAVELAECAVYLEIEVLGSPIGKQDQYAAACGGFNHIIFHPNGRVEVKNLYRDAMGDKVRLLQDSIMLFYLNGRKSDEILQDFKKEIESKREILDIQKGLVEVFRKWLVSDESRIKVGYHKNVGCVISESWKCKKGVSSLATAPWIEEIFKTALRQGALGGKLCGAGGGGFLLVLCEENLQQDMIVAMKDNLHLQFKFEPEGAKIIYEDR